MIFGNSIFYSHKGAYKGRGEYSFCLGLGFRAWEGWEGGTLVKGLKRWDEGRWGIGNKPQYSRAYAKDPLTHLPSSHLLSPELGLGCWANTEIPIGSPNGGTETAQVSHGLMSKPTLLWGREIWSLTGIVWTKKHSGTRDWRWRSSSQPKASSPTSSQDDKET